MLVQAFPATSPAYSSASSGKGSELSHAVIVGYDFAAPRGQPAQLLAGHVRRFASGHAPHPIYDFVHYIELAGGEHGRVRTAQRFCALLDADEVRNWRANIGFSNPSWITSVSLEFPHRFWNHYQNFRPIPLISLLFISHGPLMIFVSASSPESTRWG